MASNGSNQRVLVGERVTLFRRGNKGIWQMDFHHEGHRVKSTRTADLRTAKQRAMKVAVQLIDGTYEIHSSQRSLVVEPTIEGISLSVAINDFIDFHKTEGTRPKTHIRYRGILTTFREFVEGLEINLVSQVKLSTIDSYRCFRSESIATKTMHHEGSLLKSFLAWCYERKHIATNPLENRKFTPPRPNTKSVLSLDQVNAILAEATPIRFPVLATLAFTGMRSGECRNLKIEDVDLENSWIHIRSREGYETKTGQEWKTPIHPRLKEILKSHNARSNGWFFTALPSNRYPDGSHHISTKRLNEDLLRILKRLDIPAGRKSGGFTIHSLRHFFKTFCIINRVPKPVVDEWQGHARSKDPSDQYFHLTDVDSQRLMTEVPFGSNDENE